MTEEAFKRAIEIQMTRKELEKELTSLTNSKDESAIVKRSTICQELYKLGVEFAKL